MYEKKVKENFSELNCILVGINDKNDMYAFVRDLCTTAEMEEFILRWNIAKLLHKGKSYIHIQEQLWASSTTVARVAKYLQWDNKGYKKMLKSLDKRT